MAISYCKSQVVHKPMENHAILLFKNPSLYLQYFEVNNMHLKFTISFCLINGTLLFDLDTFPPVFSAQYL